MIAKVANGWTINKEISLGDVVAIVIALTSVLGAYVAIDRRVTILETVQMQLVSSDSRLEHEISTLRDDLKGALRDINAKLDVLTERSLRGKS